MTRLRITIETDFDGEHQYQQEAFFKMFETADINLEILDDVDDDLRAKIQAAAQDSFVSAMAEFKAKWDN